MSLVDVLGGLLRPAVCLACGVPGVWPCCACCLPAEPDDVGPWPLAADPDVALWALGPYRDALRAAVLAGKLDGQPAALTELGRRLGIALATAGVGADLVTYVAAAQVPGPPRDHAERVAAGVATTLDLPLVGLLALPADPTSAGPAELTARVEPNRPVELTGAVEATAWAAAWTPPAAPAPAVPITPAGQTGLPCVVRPLQPDTAWAAAGSCWSTTWPPPAARSPAPPPPSGTPAPARSRPPSSPPPPPPSGPAQVPRQPGGPGPTPGQPGQAGPTPRQPGAPGPIPRRSAFPPPPALGRLPPDPRKPRPPARPDRFRACLAPSPARLRAGRPGCLEMAL